MNDTANGQSLTIPQAIQLAVRHQAAGQLPDAERICRLILQAHPGSVDALHLLGLLSHQRGDPASAVKLIEQAIAILPRFAEAHYNLGVVYEASHKLDEAVRYYQRAIELKPDFAEAHYNLGNAWKSQGRLGEAIESYRRALAFNPGFALGHFNLGVALEDSGKPEEAALCYRQAIALNPNFADAHYNLGILLAASGNQDEADKCFRRTIELNPGHASAHLSLGNVMQRRGQMTEAVTCFQKAIAIKPDYREGYFNLGSVLQRLGRFDEAIEIWERLLGLEAGRNNYEVNFNAGMCYENANKLGKALECLDRATQIDPISAAAYEMLGRIRLKMHRASALSYIEEYWQRFPGQLSVLNLFYALALALNGRAEEATEIYRPWWQSKVYGDHIRRPWYSFAELAREENIEAQSQRYHATIESIAMEFAYIRQTLNLSKQDSFLDIGGAGGLFSIKIAPLVERVVLTDIYAELVERAKKNAQGHGNIACRVLDIAEEKPVGTFNKALMSSVTPVFASPMQLENALKNIYASLTPGGSCLVTNNYDIASAEHHAAKILREAADIPVSVLLGLTIILEEMLWIDTKRLGAMVDRIGFISMQTLNSRTNNREQTLFDFLLIK